MAKRFAYELGRALRETGQALDRVGLRAIEKPIFKEPFSRHRPVMNLYEKHPWVQNGVFVAPNATVVGRVDIQAYSSVWYGAVIRGDNNEVDIGMYTSVGDRAVITTARSTEGHVVAGVSIGSYVTIGPGALLQSCTIEDSAVIGAGAVIMEGALVEKGAIVAEGAVVHPGRRIPAGQVWGGSPAAYLRDVSKGEAAHTEGDAEAVHDLATEHAYEFLPFTTAYQQAEKLGVTDNATAEINAAQQAYEKAARGQQ